MKTKKVMTIIMLFLMAFFFFPSYSHGQADLGPIITLSFDDGHLNQYTTAWRIMEERGMVGTFYIVSDWIPDFDPKWEGTKLNSTHLIDLQNHGNEIGSHSKTHSRFTELTELQIREECNISRNVLESLGLEIDNFAYPEGLSNDTIDNVVIEYYRSGRYGGGLVDLPVTTFHIYHNGWDWGVDQYKEVVDNAYSTKKWAVLNFHFVGGDTTEGAWITEEDFAELLDYILSKGIEVLTVNQALNMHMRGQLVADFMALPTSGIEPLIVTFTDKSISSERIVSRLWDFGDGNTTILINPVVTHTYTMAGNFDAILTVIDKYGFQNNTQKTITILADNIPPITSHDYDGAWHTSDFTITLTAIDSESGVYDTHYKINQGPEKLISTNGQPKITLESGNNTLEFWSVDNKGNVENVQILTTIRLDKTKPILGNLIVAPDNDVQSDQDVKVSIEVCDSLSQVESVMLSYSIDDESTWNSLPMVFNSTRDFWGTTIPSQMNGTIVKFKITSYDKAGNIGASNKIWQYYVGQTLLEFPTWTIMPLIVAVVLIGIIYKMRLDKNRQKL